MNDTFQGFTICESGTIEVLFPFQIARMTYPVDEYVSLFAESIMLDGDGSLWIVTERGEKYLVLKEGKYDIYFTGIGVKVKY